MSAWIFLCLVWFEPTMAYLQECAAFTAPMFLFGGLVDYGIDATNLTYVSLRVTMVSIGILQSFVFDFLFFRRSARPALRASLVAWFDGFGATAGAAKDAASDGSEDALAATVRGVAGLEATLATARARLADARREPPCQAPIDAESLGLLVDALADTTHSLGALARCLAGVARDDSLQPMFARATKGFSDHASTTEEAIHFNSDDRLSAALAAFEDFRVELNKGLSDAWDAYYDGTVQKSCSDEAALARMGALAAIEHACVHLAGAASLADSADFESKGCVRSILDV